MKKIITLIICLLITANLFAFDTGTKIIGGSVNYDNYKEDKDSESYKMFLLQTFVGYFVIPDLSVNLDIWWENTSIPTGNDEISKTNEIYLGLGGSYYFRNFYGKVAFCYDFYSTKSEESKSDDTENVNGTYLDLSVGYLLPIMENVFIDIGVDYSMGFGKYTGDSDADNEETELTVGAGIAITLP